MAHGVCDPMSLSSSPLSLNPSTRGQNPTPLARRRLLASPLPRRSLFGPWPLQGPILSIFGRPEADQKIDDFSTPSKIDPKIDKKSFKQLTWLLMLFFYHVSWISGPKSNPKHTGKTIQERPGQKKWDFNLTRKNTYEKHFSHFAHHSHFQQKSKKSHSKKHQTISICFSPFLL